MIYEEKTMKSDRIYEGKVLSLRIDTVELPNKKYSKREIVEHPGAVAVVAVTEDNEVVFVRQYRKAIECELLEIPAGKLELNEDPMECAKRELKEETGYESEDMELLCETHTSPGFSNEKIYIYLAKNLKKGKANPDEDEYVESETISMEKIMNMIENKQITDSKTITGFLMTYSKLK
ncbi:ADP-ribose pyrophosphatase NudF [Gottschalkia acidurici 9a]|uniref:ADP-ribose pyrophosphatase NudF n=1 Tax=Gottschalkia acidurici (strain ATCC 7906 / DSM 604 / BCRC 14475 / CIP 104303 / KCTC 5404 / NCIMB 10678 / 9a) TaxID=1128398 RepID=K0B053_GOTA9|nr:NUDIX hydrolase [Gottschalkia acidurici]AFS78412.1 ADP-ribose pyrophosphatase NudF [Gottschalkia acidurici 9a]